MNIAIIGAGFSGCYLYSKLKEKNHNITIFEKSRGTGGRLSTKYIDDKFCDHGTPYFKSSNFLFSCFCDDLVYKDILYKEGEYYYPTSGINKMCSSLINKENLKTQTKIVKCEKTKNKWSLKDEKGKSYKNFDYLILTIPATQVLELDIELRKAFINKLSKVTYSSIGTLILHDEGKFSVDKDIQQSQFFKKAIDNSSKYGYKNFSSFVFHANEDFSTTNNYKTKEELGNEILNYINYFQKINISENVNKIAHLWKYAFVKNRINNDFLNDKDNSLSICGDFFKHLNLEGSFLSSKALYEEVFKD